MTDLTVGEIKALRKLATKAECLTKDGSAEEEFWATIIDKLSEMKREAEENGR